MPESPIRTLIADDEALARRRVRALLRDRPDFRVVAECSSGREAVAAVHEYRPDLVFLDVEMPGMSGLEALREIEPDSLPGAVVFLTAYDRYAVEAFEVHALDYLLKPFDDDRFEEALTRAKAHLDSGRLAELGERVQGLLASEAWRVAEVSRPGSAEEERAASDPAGRSDTGFVQRLTIKKGDRLIPVDTASIDWLEAAGDYVKLHTAAGAHLLRSTMRALEERLDPERFLRIHRSAIVRVDAIKELQPDFHGEYTVVLRDGTGLKLTRTYRERARAALGWDL